MGTYIIKPLAERDFYIAYDEGVDNWYVAGTREEMLDEHGVDVDRLDRADETGSSARPAFYKFGSRGEVLLFRNVGAGQKAQFLVPYSAIETMLREYEARGIEPFTDEETALFAKHGQPFTHTDH